METPSLMTDKERQAIAKEIASKYHSFASTIEVAFSKHSIRVIILADEELKLPETGTYFYTIEKEDF